ncbi:hypothetical protein WDW89_23055 [Deltaproteobacteria bacterium TL4]
MWKKCKATLGAMLVFVFIGSGLGWAQASTPEKEDNLFSVWVKLSLIGYSQSEIETALNHVDPKQLSRVKQRLRLNVIKNLRRMRLETDIEMSTTEQELSIIRDKIRTEIRFAGLENDRHITTMIQHQYGISLRNI